MAENEWNVQELNAGEFKGYIKVKESVLDNGSLFTHVVYSISNGTHTIAGINNNVDNAIAQCNEQLQRYYEIDENNAE